MSRRIILMGDTTGHGGVVMAGSPVSSIGGKPIARLGDIVSCPAHGKNKIVEGDAAHTLNEIPVALEGHRTECGALLIGSCSSFVG